MIQKTKVTSFKTFKNFDFERRTKFTAFFISSNFFSITADLHHSCILNILWLQFLWFFTRVAWGRSPQHRYIIFTIVQTTTTLLVCLLFFIFCHLIFFYYAVWSRFLFFASKKNLWVHINIIGIVFYLLSSTFLSSFVIIVSFHFSFVVLLLLSGFFFFIFF